MEQAILAGRNFCGDDRWHRRLGSPCRGLAAMAWSGAGWNFSGYGPAQGLAGWWAEVVMEGNRSGQVVRECGDEWRTNIYLRRQRGRFVGYGVEVGGWHASVVDET